jgi:hypothetical protein
MEERRFQILRDAGIYSRRTKNTTHNLAMKGNQFRRLSAPATAEESVTSSSRPSTKRARMDDEDYCTGVHEGKFKKS